MKLKPISKEAQRTAAESAGAKPLPKDHPIRSEGPSIMFLSRTQKQQLRKYIDSLQKDPKNSSD